MDELSRAVEKELVRLGADMVGFGDLRELPEDVRRGMPTGIIVAAAYPQDIIRGITELPTKEYCAWYEKLNERLDMIVTSGAKYLNEKGFGALAQSRANTAYGSTRDTTILPHKTVATRAGLGWIGKCALLVTRKYGSAFRLSSILTDAQLEPGQPVNDSACGDCVICVDACPAGAASGKLWSVGVYRDEFFDALKCRETARERARRGFGGEDMIICGKCIEVCPYTQAYLNSAAE